MLASNLGIFVIFDTPAILTLRHKPCLQLNNILLKGVSLVPLRRSKSMYEFLPLHPQVPGVEYSLGLHKKLRYAPTHPPPHELLDATAESNPSILERLYLRFGKTGDIYIPANKWRTTMGKG